MLHCGCKLYHLRDQWVAAAEQEGSVLVDYHVCPLNAPGCCISTRVRSGRSSACTPQKNPVLCPLHLSCWWMYIVRVSVHALLCCQLLLKRALWFFSSLKSCNYPKRRGHNSDSRSVHMCRGMMPALR